MTTTKQFNFLFLIDFSDESIQALDYLIKLCKKVDGIIELFYVFDSTKLGKEKGLSLPLKTIEYEKVIIKRKLNSAIEMIEAENIPATTTSPYFYNDLEKEIQYKITNQQQILALSKPNTNTFDSSFNFLINKCNKCILLIADHKPFMNGNLIVFGGDENSLQTCEKELPISFATKIKKPIILLYPNIEKKINIEKIINQSGKLEVYSKAITHNRTIDGLKEFVNNNTVELLCLSRTKSGNSLFKKLFHPDNLVSDVIGQISTSLLIMSKTNSM